MNAKPEMCNLPIKRVATYERVSSEDQRERETIKTQTESLAVRFKADPSVELVNRYADEGVSGTVPLKDRPEGRRLLRDAHSGLFDEVWVYKLDRLARDVVDALMVRRELEQLGIRVVSVCENIDGALEYSLRAVLAEEEKRTFLARSSAGMNRAAAEGRYCGGIISYGYKVEGKKPQRRLVPSDNVVWGDWTEADVVRWIFDRLAVDDWSCVKIANELNGLGVPTSYWKDERLVKERTGTRKRHTQGKWRAGRIRNLVVNTSYKGESRYGKRTTKARDIILALIPPLVSEETWEAAQRTLIANRIAAKNSNRIYLLRSVMVCGACGRTYVGTPGRGDLAWYRCNGRLTHRTPDGTDCGGKAVKSTLIESQVWADIETFLRDPGDLLKELQEQVEMDPGAAVAEAERLTLTSRLAGLEEERKTALNLRLKGRMTDEEFDEVLDGLSRNREAINQRMEILSPPEELITQPIEGDLLEEMRCRLDKGLTEVDRQQIVRLLVSRIIVHTETTDGKSCLVLKVEYRFPAVVNNSMGKDSWRPPA